MNENRPDDTALSNPATADARPAESGSGTSAAARIQGVIAKLEAATEGSCELDVAVIRAVFGYAFHAPLWHGLHYTTSLDDALTLLPGDCGWALDSCGSASVHSLAEKADHIGYLIIGECGLLLDEPLRTPALALTIAALKARVSLATESHTPRSQPGVSAETSAPDDGANPTERNDGKDQ